MDNDPLQDDSEYIEEEGSSHTHPLATASLLILAFLALLHSIALPLAFAIRDGSRAADSATGDYITAYGLGALVSAVIIGIVASFVKDRT